MRALLKSWGKSLLDNPAGDRVRPFLGLKPLLVTRPWRHDAAVSDLFPWRCDDLWDTRFDLANIPSLLVPGQDAVDRVTAVLFDAGGSEIARHAVDVPPRAVVPMTIGQFPSRPRGSGTLAVFHDTAGLTNLMKHKGYLAERGYLAFRRRGDPLWSYVHGNLNVLAKAPADDAIEHTVGRSPGPHVYRPQLNFDDCIRFEIIVSNPARDSQSVELRLFDRRRNVIDIRTADLPSRGMSVFAIDRKTAPVSMIETRGRVPMWRPVIFKFYESHFDVLHG